MYIKYVRYCWKNIPSYLLFLPHTGAIFLFSSTNTRWEIADTGCKVYRVYYRVCVPVTAYTCLCISLCVSVCVCVPVCYAINTGKITKSFFLLFHLSSSSLEFVRVESPSDNKFRCFPFFFFYDMYFLYKIVKTGVRLLGMKDLLQHPLQRWREKRVDKI